MDLMHNQLFRINPDHPSIGYRAGIYRVVWTYPESKLVVAALIKDKVDDPKKGRPKKSKNPKRKKNPPLPLIGELFWLDAEDLHQLKKEHYLHVVQDDREALYLKELKTERAKELLEMRIDSMSEFLDLHTLSEEIMASHGAATLISRGMQRTGRSESHFRKLFSLLCRFGFSAISLHPRTPNCGAKGKPRPFGPNQRKAGRKDRAQRKARDGEKLLIESRQPGMSLEWQTKTLQADKQIKEPKPKFSIRYQTILELGFTENYKHVDGKLVADLREGEYPTISQVKYFLQNTYSLIQRVLHSTSLGHYARAKRGLKSKNRRGVSGPGHTWAVDSTVGDIYLRSSINRAWIVGRPIVYIVVDVWSTAIVGFYVCLTGPCWDTARISLFNSAVDPQLLGELWGYTPVMTLNPQPTMCHCLMADRGEYLSRAARITGEKFIRVFSYGPPYRPDLRGLVEVLHRIVKDTQFQMFVPGAMDARRKEFDLRKSNPSQSVFTVREYTEFLYYLFCLYNLTADRSKRIDSTMAAYNVMPSPSGLWSWGHHIGIGFNRAIPTSDLIQGLLPMDAASLTGKAITFARNEYSSPLIESLGWTSIARNYGGSTVPVHFYPGTTQRIWLPNPTGKGFETLTLSDLARTPKITTYDEMRDWNEFQLEKKPHQTHEKTILQVGFLHEQKARIEKASKLTAEAEMGNTEPVPNFTEARQMENEANQARPKKQPVQATVMAHDQAQEDHERALQESLQNRRAQSKT